MRWILRTGWCLLAAVICHPSPAAAQATDALYQEACDDGDVSACNVFGLMVELGRGVPQDLPRARLLYRRACEAGSLVGCTNLGLMYEEGSGGPRDVDEARGRFRIACEGNEQLACDILDAIEDSEVDGAEGTRHLKVGRVSDAETTTALSDALVAVPELGILEVADAQGRVSLGRLPEGRYLIRAERRGYAVMNGELQVPGGAQFMIMMERDDSENPNAPGRIEGQVTDGGNGEVRDVDVSVIGQERLRTLSNQRGFFALTGVEPGLVQLRFTRLGYAPRTATLVVQPGRTSDVTVAMAPEAIELAPIEVTVQSEFLNRNGYYDRARQGLGNQYDRRELDRLAPFEVSDVIRRTPGVRLLQPNVVGAAQRVINPRINSPANGDCFMDIYVDAVRMSDGDVNQLPTDWLDAMEVYAGSETPIQYSGLNPCGVVLLWTRR